MQRKKNPIKVISTGLIMLAISATIWLASATPANAQCGSQASSCKNCHEVQGEMPVNNDGSAWHTSHAFGDFCYICHAGNNQATDIGEAHTGMVPPLTDIQASCQQCHYEDLEERAQVYADVLGVSLNQDAAPAEETTSDPGAAEVSTGIGLMAPTDIEVDDPNLVDYVQRYNTIVLGEKPIDLGNLIVVGLIGVVILGGGAFVIHNEGWAGVDYQQVDEYPAELVELLPAVSRLSPTARKNLQQILSDPKQADQILSKIEVPKE
ncbi:MAG: hypothetical protein ABFS17_13715 [Chloroflexota bacterium]